MSKLSVFIGKLKTSVEFGIKDATFMAVYRPQTLFIATLLLGSVLVASAAAPVSGHIVKVLPLYLDQNGRDAVSPSLFDRDAYQAYLRDHTTDVSTLRFDVLWKGSAEKHVKFRLQAEVRGIGPDGLPRQVLVEKEVGPGLFSRWTSLALDVNGIDKVYKNLGTLVAWRITIWNGNQLLSEQKSFLW